MGSSTAPWKGVPSAWFGIVVAGAAAVVVEVLVLEEWRGAFIATTATVAAFAGLIATRRLFVRNRQPLITVRDLRHR
jgi:hypothetical protein